MKTAAAQALRETADKIDRLDKFIRRDNGSTSVRATIEQIVDANTGDRGRMIDELDKFTRKLRDTAAAYVEGQFQ